VCGGDAALCQITLPLVAITVYDSVDVIVLSIVSCVSEPQHPINQSSPIAIDLGGHWSPYNSVTTVIQSKQNVCTPEDRNYFADLNYTAEVLVAHILKKRSNSSGYVTKISA